jgi:hypothetical protein
MQYILSFSCRYSIYLVLKTDLEADRSPLLLLTCVVLYLVCVMDVAQQKKPLRMFLAPIFSLWCFENSGNSSTHNVRHHVPFLSLRVIPTAIMQDLYGLGDHSNARTNV